MSDVTSSAKGGNSVDISEFAPLARAVVGEAVGRMERLLVAGVERAAVLGACEELLRLGEDLPPTAGAHTTSKPGAHAPVYRLH